MQESDIYWNEQARAKILEDSDRVLREAVLDLANSEADSSSDDLVAQLNSRMKDRFIDFEPGPDLRKYADAIVSGEFAESADAPRTAPSHSQGSDSAASDSAGAAGGSASLDSQDGNGVAADPGSGALAPDAGGSDAGVNDG